MVPNPACWPLNGSLVAAARLMVATHLQVLPVVENTESLKLVGVITARSIVWRAVAEGRLDLPVAECMTSTCVSVPAQCSVEECSRAMIETKTHRVFVVNDDGRLCGIVFLADIAASRSESVSQSRSSRR
jgi:CBS domain-containing protein